MRDIEGPLRTSKELRPAGFQFCIIVMGDVRFPANEISRRHGIAHFSGHLFLAVQTTVMQNGFRQRPPRRRSATA